MRNAKKLFTKSFFLFCPDSIFTMKYTAKRKAHLKLGRRGEQLCAALLKHKGMVILARNFRTSYGELDIVARDGGTLVFVEVKTLRKICKYRPIDNYKVRQMRRNIRAAHEYVRLVEAMHMPLRFDFTEVILPEFGFMKIYHYKDFMQGVDNRRLL